MSHLSTFGPVNRFLQTLVWKLCNYRPHQLALFISHNP